MNPRSLFVLALVLIGVAVGLQFLPGPSDEPTPEELQAPSLDTSSDTLQVLFDRQGETVREVQIHRQSTQDLVRVVPRADGHWEVTDPFLDRAEPTLVGQLFFALERTPLTPLPASWAARTDAELGLEAAETVLEIVREDGSLWRLDLGTRLPEATQLFAKANGQRVLVPRALEDLLERPSMQWRDHAVLRYARHVRTLRWQPEGAEGYTVVRQGQGWLLQEPLEARVDPIRARGFDRLLGMRVSSLPTDLAPAEILEELEGRGGVLELTSVVEGEERTERFQIFDGILLDQNRPYLLPIYGEDLGVLGFDAEGLRSKRLLTFEPNHIASLRLTLPDGPVELRKSSQGWGTNDGRLLTPAARKRLTQLLVQLGSLEIGDSADRPAGELARQLLLSISARPVERGATVLRWWPAAEGSVVAEGRSGSTFVSAMDLDAAIGEILAGMPQD